MDPQELVTIIGTSAAIYFSLLALLRFTGKRPPGSYTSLDLVVALVIGELALRPLHGLMSLPTALLLVSGLVGLHYLTSYVSCVSLRLDYLIGGAPRVVVRNGVVSQRALAAERVTERDLRALLRRQGIERLDEVKLAALEPNGVLSIVRTEKARPLRRSDLQQLLTTVRKEAAQ